MNTYVLGHKNPDVDSFASATVFCDYLAINGVEASVLLSSGNFNKEILFVSNFFKAALPKQVDTLPVGSKLYLVDHNATEQIIDGNKECEIIGIIDHRNIEFLITKEPLFVRIEKVGATCTIVAKMFEEKGIILNVTQAGLLLAGILSDTLHFRSPTTTPEDKEYAQKLAQTAQIEDIKALADEMFAAKSDLWDLSISTVVQLVYKIFIYGEKRIGIGTIETINPAWAFERKEEIIKVLIELKIRDRLDLVFLCVVDIVKEENISLYADDADKTILEEVFGGKGELNQIHLGSRLSRKKEVVPEIGEYFSK